MSNKLSVRKTFGLRQESSSIYTTLSSKHQTVSSIKNQEETPFYLKLSSGAVAGMSGTTVVFPIDLVKTRLQTQRRSFVYKSGLDCLFKVLRTEGFRGLYRGLQSNLIGIAPEKAIKLAINDGMRHYFSRSLGIPENELPMKYGMISGATAGLCQVIATNPMEVVKIQMQLAGASGGSPKSLVNVVQQLGVKGLYHGASATLCRDIPFSIIFFSSFSLFKSFFKDESSSQPSLPKVFVSGILAAGIGALFATPMDLVKTRIQASVHNHGILEIMNHHKRSSILNFYMDIIRNEGYLALMKGAPQVCLMVAPLLGTSIFVYELQQRLIKRFVS